jgi:hypothetical protein
MVVRAYAGIGSRETPPEILQIMELAAEALAWQGWTLRSGHAPGADQAFEFAAPDHLTEIYLPWPSFEASTPVAASVILDSPHPAAIRMAQEHHPAWVRLSQGAQKLHARNCHQIFGRELRKDRAVKFVLCWTKDGKATGGTGQAIRLAEAHRIAVRNLHDPRVRWRVEQMIETYQTETEPS